MAMDIDKIVTDLVEKRLQDRLAMAVADHFHSEGDAALSQFIQQIIPGCLIERESEIKAAVKLAIDKAVFTSIIVPRFGYEVHFNMSVWELEKQLAEAKRREKEGSDNRKG